MPINASDRNMFYVICTPCLNKLASSTQAQYKEVGRLQAGSHIVDMC